MTAKGRPRIDGTAKRPQSVHLTAEHIAIAKRLGDGNVSAGVREALTRADAPPVSAPQKS